MLEWLVIVFAVGLATSLVAAAAALLIAAVLIRPRGVSAGELLRLFPDSVRLLANLSRDRRVGRAVRWRLLMALAYNAQPVNVIPDFVPVIGLADNMVVTAWALRSAIRKAGPAIVLSNWRGSQAGFALLCRLCRLKVPGRTNEKSKESPASVAAPGSPASPTGSVRDLLPGDGRVGPSSNAGRQICPLS